MGITLKGIVGAPVTPFTPDNRIDRATLEKLVNFLIEQGSGVIALPMHMGESINLSIPERKELAEIAVKTTARRVPVVVNVSLSGTDQVIELAQHAQQVGADAVIVTAPYYWPSTQEALLDHFLTVGAAIDIPFLCYNNLHVGPSLSVPMIAELIDRTDRLVGFKDASFDMVYFTELCRVTLGLRPTFSIFPGIEYLVPTMPLGGVGAFSGSNAVTPRLVNDLYTLCLKGDYAAARPLQYKVGQLWRILTVGYPAAVKAAMEMMGRPAGVTRKPIPPLTEEGKKKLRADLEAMGVLDDEPRGW